MRRRPLGQEEPEQDPFFETVDRGLEFARERALPLTYAGVAILVLGVLLVWYLSQRSTDRVDAFVQVYTAQAAFQDAAQADPEERAAELDDVATQFGSVTSQDYAVQARFMTARAAFEKGDFAEAARLFEETATPENGELGLYAQVAHASALEQEENWQEAAAAYDPATLEPYAAMPGYAYAWTEAALGQARAARRMGEPTKAREAYERVVERYGSVRQDAITERETELVGKVRDFLQRQTVVVDETSTDVDAVQSELDDWIATTLQKPEAQRIGLHDALRYRSQVEEFRRAVVQMKQEEIKAVGDGAINAQRRAAGNVPLAPTFDQYQRALLELDRLDEMTR